MTASQTTQATKAGFVAIIGAPNAGKSTLLNSLVGQKIAIVTPKINTTRATMRGIVTTDDTQYIFVDTPGIYRPKKRLLDKSMVAAAWDAQQDADVVLFMVDAKMGFKGKAEDVLQGLENAKEEGRLPPCYVAFNKVDGLNKDLLLPLMQQAAEKELFAGVFAISALKNNGVNDMLKQFATHFPESPFLYDPEDITDSPMRLIAAEITRERAFMTLKEEIPYAMAVETVTYEMDEDGVVNIHQNILVEKESQKRMVIGKGGQMIKKIGEKARKALREMTGTPVRLFLNAKVRENWAENANFIREIGLEPAKGKTNKQKFQK